ncbi:MAG: hypothetical protein VX033_03775, partial [Verrucomicrobiota bacterium]|nr:hypothetical protein [Verrucomicrobiota bacterium]
PNRPIDAQTSGLGKGFYGIFIGLIALSGLSVDWLNSLTLNELVSPIRVCWVVVFLYIVANLRWDYRALISLPVALLAAWIVLHVLNLIFLNGAANAIMTRIFQASFITALLIITLQRGFDLSNLCKAINPLIALFAGIALIVFLVSSVQSARLFFAIQGSIIGVSSNFSIFCSQLFALFLFKDLYSKPSKERSLFKSIVLIVLITLPILGWQVLSSGRAGVIMTIIAACGYGFAKERLKGAFVAFLVLLATIITLNEAFNYFPYLFELTRDLLTKGIGVARQGDGIFRKLDLALSTFSSIQSAQTLENFDKLSSWRINGLLQTLDALESDKFWLGFGVNNFKVTTLTGEIYPHIELLRYFAELGVFGALLAATIYAYPFAKIAIHRNLLRNNVVVFSLIYMTGFLLTTLLQPSGPLTHLNNTWLFWI